MQDNFKYQRIKKIHQVLEKRTRIDPNTKIYCVLLSHELLSIKIYYTSIYIFHFLFIARQFQKLENDANPTSTSGDTHKTSFIIVFYWRLI